jgi:hypothetical protein
MHPIYQLLHLFHQPFQPHALLQKRKTQINVCSMLKQVCGNSEHVKFLAEWLKGWDERGHKTGAANGDTNDSSYQDESDADSSDNASECDNVLLITGPVGVSATQEYLPFKSHTMSKCLLASSFCILYFVMLVVF